MMRTIKARINNKGDKMDNTTNGRSPIVMRSEKKRFTIKLIIRLFLNIAEHTAMLDLAVSYKYTFPDKRPSLFVFWLIKAATIILLQLPIFLTYKIRPFESKGCKKAYIIMSAVLTGIVAAYWLVYAHFGWYF